jgi:transaldolase
MKKILNLKKISLYADGAALQQILSYNKLKYIKGFTTNPSLMRKSGVRNYKSFAKSLLKKIKKKPISFEVFSDDFQGMYNEALKISSWGKNVYVKIPIQNSKGKLTVSLIKKLQEKKIKLNITAIFTIKQIKSLINIINEESDIILSIFAGRIADTGVDPALLIKKTISITKKFKNLRILWASTREVLNIFQAEDLGCHIITIPFDILKKLKFVGMCHNKLSLDTVKSFYQDARASKFKI